MNIRMIGFDLDGTLLTTDKILTERTKKALEAAADQGVILVPATGRPLCGLPKELLELPFIKYAVTANGAKNRTSFIRNVNFGRKSARNIGYFLRL